MMPAVLTVSAALLDVPLYEADIVTVEVDDTLFVDTVNVLLTEPAGTVALAGTLATTELLEDNVTAAPPAGAGCDSVTVAAEFPPPISEEGFRAIDESTGGIVALPTTVSAALLDVL
jgi:hypothetical protein